MTAIIIGVIIAIVATVANIIILYAMTNHINRKANKYIEVTTKSLKSSLDYERKEKLELIDKSFEANKREEQYKKIQKNLLSEKGQQQQLIDRLRSEINSRKEQQQQLSDELKAAKLDLNNAISLEDVDKKQLTERNLKLEKEITDSREREKQIAQKLIEEVKAHQETRKKLQDKHNEDEDY